MNEEEEFTGAQDPYPGFSAAFRKARDKWEPLWAQALEMAAGLEGTSQCTNCTHDYAEHNISTVGSLVGMHCTKCECLMTNGRGKGDEG